MTSWRHCHQWSPLTTTRSRQTGAIFSLPTVLSLFSLFFIRKSSSTFYCGEEYCFYFVLFFVIILPLCFLYFCIFFFIYFFVTIFSSLLSYLQILYIILIIYIYMFAHNALNIAFFNIMVLFY